MTGQTRLQQPSVPPVDVWAELRIIPWWGYALAVAVYVGIQVLFHGVAWPREINPPRLAFRVLFPLFMGMIPACLVLLIGYVNRDAGRRRMSRALWTIVVIFVPSAIGFVLYFLLRNPIQGGCPGCGSMVDSGANYCPRCRYNFHPTCTQCKAAVHPGDRFCARCGAELAEVA
jgi:hypothetical protein